MPGRTLLAESRWTSFVHLLQEVVQEAGIKRAQIFSGRKASELPGFYRPTKNWDWIVVADNQLVAVLELKSQVGPSFGNNFNNRVEEALGNATDLWKAYSEGTFTLSPRPWAGFLMFLEDCPGSTTPVRVDEPQFPIRTEFCDEAYSREVSPIGVSYAKRYELFCRKVMRDRLYDATCLMLSSATTGRKGDFSEPAADLSFGNFVASLLRRVTEHVKLKKIGK